MLISNWMDFINNFGPQLYCLFYIVYVCQYYHYLEFIIIIFYKLYILEKLIGLSNFPTSSIKVEDSPEVDMCMRKILSKGLLLSKESEI